MEFNVEKTIAKVAASRVKMVLAFRAYGDIRYYLGSVEIRPAADGGVLVTATDGHIAAVVTDIGGRAGESLLLPIGKEQKSYLTKAESVFVDDARYVWIVDEDLNPLWVSPVPCIEGTYPSISKAVGDVSKYKPGLFGAFNPKLIDRIRQIYGNNAKYKAVRFFTHEENNGLAMFTLEGDGFGVVMGMRDSAENDPLLAIAKSVPSDFLEAA